MDINLAGQDFLLSQECEIRYHLIKVMLASWQPPSINFAL
jgi:hypothetical protein